jgi:hypothetical protein
MNKYDMLGNRSHRRKVVNPRDTMLADFLRAKTPYEKREIIKTFSPHYFVFGNTLDPRNPYEEGEVCHEL